jgi:hypothetical protein
MTYENRPRRSSRSCGAPRFLAPALVLAVALAAGTAHAERGKLVDLHGAVLVGGQLGRGTDSTIPDLYHQAQGPGFGAEVGARLLVLDLSIRFLQTVTQNGWQGTMLSALLGPSIEIPVARNVVIRPGLAGGFVFGTSGPVDPPLTNDQLAGKGFLVVGRFAVERMFGPIFGLGGEVQGGYHYLFGANAVVNGKDHSSGWQTGVFATAAFHLGV